MEKLNIVSVQVPDGYREGKFTSRWKTFNLVVYNPKAKKTYTMLLSTPDYEQFIAEQAILALGVDPKLVEKLSETARYVGELNECDNNAGDSL